MSRHELLGYSVKPGEMARQSKNIINSTMKLGDDYIASSNHSGLKLQAVRMLVLGWLSTIERLFQEYVFLQRIAYFPPSYFFIES